jgi:signal peptidase II
MKELARIRWIWLALVILLADQASKLQVERIIQRDSPRVLVPGLLNLVYTNNPGVAFSLLADVRSPWVTPVLIFFAAAVMIFLTWLLNTGRAGGRWGRAGMALILGGAAGNVLDRLLRSSVTDFIDLHLREHHWYVFNVADTAIVLGAAMVLWKLSRDWRQPAEDSVSFERGGEL